MPVYGYEYRTWQVATMKLAAELNAMDNHGWDVIGVFPVHIPAMVMVVGRRPRSEDGSTEAEL